MELVSLGVEVLHASFLKGGFFKLVIGPECAVKLVAGHHVFKLGTVEGLAFARFGELEVNNYIGFTIYLNFQALT